MTLMSCTHCGAPMCAWGMSGAMTDHVLALAARSHCFAHVMALVHKGAGPCLVVKQCLCCGNGKRPVPLPTLAMKRHLAVQCRLRLSGIQGGLCLLGMSVTRTLWNPCLSGASLSLTLRKLDRTAPLSQPQHQGQGLMMTVQGHGHLRCLPWCLVQTTTADLSQRPPCPCCLTPGAKWSSNQTNQTPLAFGAC